MYDIVNGAGWGGPTVINSSEFPRGPSSTTNSVSGCRCWAPKGQKVLPGYADVPCRHRTSSLQSPDGKTLLGSDAEFTWHEYFIAWSLEIVLPSSLLSDWLPAKLLLSLAGARVTRDKPWEAAPAQQGAGLSPQHRVGSCSATLWPPGKGHSCCNLWFYGPT